MILAETYPAEFYRHLGLDLRQAGLGGLQAGFQARTPRTGKRSQASRQANAGRLLGWAESHSVFIDPLTRAAIADGFGRRAAGEDAFDALVGLFGMLNILAGERPAEGPADSQLIAIEGWILGQQLE